MFLPDFSRNSQNKQYGKPQMRVTRFLRSQTLYNECALVTENELVEKRKLQPENICYF